MKRFLSRFFTQRKAGKPLRGHHDKPRSGDDGSHHQFRTPRGQGPFLLSCDGRVIPLRKAKFLRQH